MKYRWHTKPYAHQIKGVKFALSQFDAGRGVALLMEPRTGKTKTTIDTLAVLHQMKQLRKVLVIAPNRVMDTWVEEFHRHTGLRIEIVVWDARSRRLSALPSYVHPAYDMQVVITNYETFATPGRTLPSGRRSHASGRFKNRKKLLAWLAGDQAACVVDEGHKIKSPSGKASNMIVSMRDVFAYRFLLTGTPVTKAKRAHDVFMQWQWVNPDRFSTWGATVNDFRNHTGRWINANGFPQWTGPRTAGMRDLKDGVHADAFAITRDECFDLPPRLPDRIINIELEASAQHYDEMAEDMVTQLKSGAIAEASIPLVVSLRLLQITSGFVGIPERRVVRGRERLVSVPHVIGMEKITALEELLTEECRENEEKIVIAARFIYDLDNISALCDSLKLPNWTIRGKVKREDSTRAIHDFRRHDGAGVMIVQPAAASLGIDLSTSAHMVWYSLTPSWVDFSQACDRIALSPRGTTYTFLMARGTVDHLLYDTLMMDKDTNREILRRPEALLRR